VKTSHDYVHTNVVTYEGVVIN